MNKCFVMWDGNQAVADVAYRLNEIIAIYPITPSSPMAEWADAWMSERRQNLWGVVPLVYEMQSEAGVAGAVHGALQTGALATTFTASQGLLLMIPNMYKIAGELTPAVFHIAARSLAAQGLSIFGDHSDVMAARQTGWAMICSSSVQEAMDLALISQATSLECRIPFLHFFDGFRTSHEVAKIERIDDDILRAMINEAALKAHRSRALTPDRPVLRGTAQNPDVYFQARETVNPFYAACPSLIQKTMDQFADLTGRRYALYEYRGDPQAERVIVLMGSSCETVGETVRVLQAQGEKVGFVNVRLYRPFDAARFVASLPETVKSIAVLDRTKEPGAGGEPLYLDVVAAIYEELAANRARFNENPRIVGGRYGLSSKEFTPAMAKAVFENLKAPSPKNHFTIGIEDDVSQTSLPWDKTWSVESVEVVRALFYGLGSDGTVGANKNSIKIIGEHTQGYAQGYFVYDSKKSGSITISHLRFGPSPIRAPYLVTQANFIGIHQPGFVDRYDLLTAMAPGGTVLLNTPHAAERVWDELPTLFQEHVLQKKLRLYAIDAYKVAAQSGMDGYINTVMQVCFFSISGVLPHDQAIAQIKESIRKTYGKKGDEVIQMNLKAVDQTLERLFEIKFPEKVTSTKRLQPAVAPGAPPFVVQVLGKMMINEGDDIPVSALPVDGTYSTATTQWEKRNLAQDIPVWDPAICIQCNKCVLICPHGVIRAKVVEPATLAGGPATLKSRDAIDRDWKGLKYLLQVSPEDCTGCSLCVEICPSRNKSETRLKAINMAPQAPLRVQESDNWNFFLNLPEFDRRKLKVEKLNQQQIQRPLFEFSGACAGCGETPYLKLLSQLFGDRALIANATGCSSIYGGNLPTTPWAKDQAGRGPAWSNSLFEDNAEFGLGYRLSLNQQRTAADVLLKTLAPQVGEELVDAILGAGQSDEAGIHDQRERVRSLSERLRAIRTPEARQLEGLAEAFVKKSVWIVGGDGWAFDIGFGGLDHVMSSGLDVNILVLDTGVYSNTGGQRSKATPRGAVAKFAAGGKESARKDLGFMAMSYGNVYVSQVAMGSRDEQTLRAFVEAESFNGPSLIIAYSHCIAHGIRMELALESQKAAVASGQWLLYRYDPRRLERGEKALVIDSRPPSMKVQDYLLRENRFKMLTKSHPDSARAFWNQAQEDADARWKLYEHMANRAPPPAKEA